MGDAGPDETGSMRHAQHRDHHTDGGHDHGAEFNGQALLQPGQCAAQRIFCYQWLEVDFKRIGQGFSLGFGLLVGNASLFAFPLLAVYFLWKRGSDVVGDFRRPFGGLG